VSDDPVTRILSAIERLRAEVLTRIDRLESVSSGRTDLVSEVVAHIQNVGDVEGKFGDWIGDRHSGRWIEGFRITPPQNVASEELLYRVVLGRDQLSPWSPSGSFCGSEGLALPLRGLCLTLRGQAAANYQCSYAATFVDGSMAGLTPGGQICAAATFAPLEAFQINLRALAR
jgi:hypothetical protein